MFAQWVRRLGLTSPTLPPLTLAYLANHAELEFGGLGRWRIFVPDVTGARVQVPARVLRRVDARLPVLLALLRRVRATTTSTATEQCFHSTLQLWLGQWPVAVPHPEAHNKATFKRYLGQIRDITPLHHNYQLSGLLILTDQYRGVEYAYSCSMGTIILAPDQLDTLYPGALSKLQAASTLGLSSKEVATYVFDMPADPPSSASLAELGALIP